MDRVQYKTTWFADELSSRFWTRWLAKASWIASEHWTSVTQSTWAKPRCWNSSAKEVG